MLRNHVGLLQGCVHGTIGVTVTLAHLGRLSPGEHRIETPVGVVEVQLHDHGRVSVENVCFGVQLIFDIACKLNGVGDYA